MQKDAYYYPHFCNARHDRKIKRLRKELGIEGYGIYFMLLEVLREQENFKYPISDIDLLAEEFGTSEQKVRVTICNYHLFEVDENELFFSTKFIEYLQPYIVMKEQRRLAGIKSGEARRQKNELMLNDRSTNDERELNENEQSKLKETKLKEIKEKDNKAELFESFWNLYDKKVSREKCLSKFQKLNKKEIDKIFETLPAYVKSTENDNGKFRKNPETYLNNKSWNDEILAFDKPTTNGTTKDYDDDYPYKHLPILR